MKWLQALPLALATLAADDNWPQFRGPGASGVGGGSPPVEWNGEKGRSIRWKTEIPGLGFSSPVIWRDRIFLTTAVSAKGVYELKLGLYGNIQPVNDEGSQTFSVYCLDRKSGKVLWKRDVASREPKVKRHPKSTHANPSAATDGRYVTVFFGSEGLYTFDVNGKLLWQKDFGTLDAGFFMVPAAQWGFSSSPVIHNGVIIIQADVQKDSFLAAFDAATGKELWRTARADVPTFGTPAVASYTDGGAKGLQVAVNGFKHIGGYDFKTGKELWRMRGTGDIPVPTPVSLGNLIVFTSAHGPGRPIYAVRTDAAGDLNENRAGLAWSQERAGNYMQTPVLHDGLAYFCFDNGVLTVFQLATGERIYQQRLGEGKSGFSSSPVLAGGRLYVTNEEGRTYVVAAGREYKLLAENELGEQVMASPALSENTLYLRGRRHLFAIGK